MSRSASIFSVVVVMTVTVLATVAVAFAVPGEGSNGQAKVPICHKPGTPAEKTLYLPESALRGHLGHGDTMPENSATEPENGDTELENGDTELENPEDACETAGAPPEAPFEDATLTTDASDATLPDGTISDVATLDVPDGTTGTIEFKLYGPFTTLAEITPDSCVDEDDPGPPPVEANLLFTDTEAVPTDEDDPDGSGQYTSDPFTPTAPGFYQWVATFTSDTEGVDSSSSPCGDTTEQSLVTDATSTTATEQNNMTLAGEISEDANLADPATDTTDIEGTNQGVNTSAGTDNEDDDLYGDASANILLGRHGNDYLEGGQGPDRMVGGKQGDFVNGADGKPANDVINGGIGTDYCVGDVRDEFRNCDGNVAKVPVPPQSAAP
jgi:hypothetical protein